MRVRLLRKARPDHEGLSATVSSHMKAMGKASEEFSQKSDGLRSILKLEEGRTI